MDEIECLKQIKALCWEHIRMTECPSVLVGQIMQDVQGHLVRTGNAPGVVVGNGEFNVNGKDLLGGHRPQRS